MAKELPKFKGYTVDIKLRQFRRVTQKPSIEFIDFDTEKGEKLLAKYIKKAKLRKAELNSLIEIF